MDIRTLTPSTLIALVVLVGLSCSPATPKQVVPQTAEDAKQALLDQGIHISQKTFFQSVGKNDFEAVDLFFVAGIDVNVQGEYGSTALSMTTSQHQAQMAEMLLAHGADPNILTTTGHGPLNFAAANNAAEVVELLLDAGAGPNLGGDDERTPLREAAVRGHVEVARLLLAHGAQVDATALRWAKEKGHTKIVEMLEAAEEHREPKSPPQSRTPTSEDPPTQEASSDEDAPNRSTAVSQVAQASSDIDDHFTVVVYGLSDDAPYDTRLFELIVPAMAEVFPVAEYPGMKELAETYRVLMDDPTTGHGDATQRIMNEFMETLSPSDVEKFQEVYMGLVEQEMAKAQVRYWRDTLDGLLLAFSRATYPQLNDLASAVEAFEKEMTDAKREKVAETMAAFEAALNAEDGARVKSIKEAVDEGMSQVDPVVAAETERQNVKQWVEDAEGFKGWVNSEPGEPVSPEAFVRLAANMSYEEASTTMGRDGKSTFSANIRVNDYVSKSSAYEWSWHMPSGVTAKVNAWFLNDKLRVKSCSEIAD